MRQSEILVGHKYSNGVDGLCERHRKIVGMFLALKRDYTGDVYVTVIDTYSDMKSITTYPPYSYDILLKSFARWAKKDIT